MVDHRDILARAQTAAWWSALRSPRVDRAALEGLLRKPVPLREPPQLVRKAIEWIARHELDGENEIGATNVAEARLMFAILVKLGRMATAADYFAACDRRLSPAWRPPGADILTGTHGMPAVSRLGDDETRDVQVVRVPGATTTFVLFCGLAQQFSVALNLLDLYLQQVPANVIYLRDFSLALYLQGVLTLGDAATSIRRLRVMLENLGTKRIACAGSSAGSLGAVLYGLGLGAAEVVCFAGPMTLDHGIEKKENTPTYYRLKQQISSGLLARPDVRRDLEGSKTVVRYLYSEDNAFDRLQANVIAGLPNVAIETHPGDMHAVVLVMASRGTLTGLFADLAQG